MNSIDFMQQQQADLLDLLKRIQALSENPHWTPDRKQRVAELASKGIRLLEAFRP